MPIRWFFTLGLFVLLAAPAAAQKFYPDDPVDSVPPLWPTYDPQVRALSAILEQVNHTFGTPGEHHPERGVIPADGVNTLGEVMDGPWFVNRHGKDRMSREALLRGPGNDRPPRKDAQWRVLTVKKFGVRPGILVADSTNQLYLLRFDPPGWLEMSTGAELVTSRIFHALGYFVPENYIVYFDRDQLTIEEGAQRVTSAGDRGDLIEEDVDGFLKDVARDPERGYRAVATRVPGSWEGLLGPYQVFGTRSDDPNDVVPHEHRRDQRGLFVFSAWLNHNKMRAVNTLDVLMNVDDVPIIRHYLIDFTHTLGSAAAEPKRAREGNQALFDVGEAVKQIAGMGIYTPRWMRASYPSYRAAGHFEYRTFEPERWQADADIVPFANRLPDDTYWAAKQVMAFTDDDIETLVSTGQYSDAEAEAWIVKCLIERRNRIGDVYFARVLPLEGFGVRDGAVHFEDLAVERGFGGARRYNYQWSRFDNEAETHALIGGVNPSPELPPAATSAAQGSYFAVRISGGEQSKNVLVYLRKAAGGFNVVGVERNWPGKLIADPSLEVDTGISRYADLQPIQKDLFAGYAKDYNERTGFDLPAQEYFDSLTISERTTFDAVTHALMSSELTDENQASLGNAIDVVAGVERISGQYYGRSGDEQFRLYVFLKPGARETLERSREFALGHLNTVYHVGYPYSFRQGGNLPSIQFSMSEEADKADIDVDYRSSKFPQAMFNGHLTSANSDVRAGDNHERHANRWGGFAAWWQGVFGTLDHDEEQVGGPDLMSREAIETPTPLPDNRPPAAEPDELYDAAQEFLTDWLVRRNVDEAALFFSTRVLACVNTDEDIDEEILRGQGAAAALRDGMEHTNDELGDFGNLTEAIDVVLPWRESIRVRSHPYENDFAVLELTDSDASAYLCGETLPSTSPGTYGTYFATLFRFKTMGGAALGIIWTRENGSWRIVSYEVFQQ